MAATEEHIGLELALAIRAGDLRQISELLEAHQGLAAQPIAALGSRTPLMVVADWPGYFPNGAQVVQLLVAAGADPNATAKGSEEPDEGPLHWAASSDDVDVAEALLDAGADIEAPRLLDRRRRAAGKRRGIRMLARRAAAAGARRPRPAFLASRRPRSAAAGRGVPRRIPLARPAQRSITHSGRHVTAASGAWPSCCSSRGADINWVPDYAEETPLQIAGSADTCRGILSDWLREQGAT